MRPLMGVLYVAILAQGSNLYRPSAQAFVDAQALMRGPYKALLLVTLAASTATLRPWLRLRPRSVLEGPVQWASLISLVFLASLASWLAFLASLAS